MTDNLRQLKRVIALDREVDLGVSTLRNGLAILGRSRSWDQDLPSILALLSLGSERLLKLTLGVISEANGDPWPTKAELRQLGHDIAHLDQTLRPILRERTSLSTAPGQITKLMEAVEDDHVLAGVLRTLGRFAIDGRFWDLDYLASNEAQGPSPSVMWDEEVGAAVWSSDPVVMDAVASGNRGPLVDRIDSSIRSWFELYAAAWATGVAGPSAKQWGPRLRL